MYGKVHTCKHLPDNFPIQNSLEQGNALSQLLLNFALKICLTPLLAIRITLDSIS
jgi:hypothetical protein